MLSLTRRHGLVILATALLLLAAPAIAQEGNETTEGNDAAGAPVNDTREVEQTLVLSEGGGTPAEPYTIQPARFTVEEGFNLTLVVRNHPESLQRHSFALEGYNVSMEPLAPGEERRVNLTLHQVGNFTYHSDYKTDRAWGMEGLMVVQENESAPKVQPPPGDAPPEDDLDVPGAGVVAMAVALSAAVALTGRR